MTTTLTTVFAVIGGIAATVPAIVCSPTRRCKGFRAERSGCSAIAPCDCVVIWLR